MAPRPSPCPGGALVLDAFMFGAAHACAVLTDCTGCAVCIISSRRKMLPRPLIHRPPPRSIHGSINGTPRPQQPTRPRPGPFDCLIDATRQTDKPPVTTQQVSTFIPCRFRATTTSLSPCRFMSHLVSSTALNCTAHHTVLCLPCFENNQSDEGEHEKKKKKGRISSRPTHMAAPRMTWRRWCHQTVNNKDTRQGQPASMGQCQRLHATSCLQRHLPACSSPACPGPGRV